MRKINKIIIHCSDTTDSGTKSWDAIRKYHIETNGWKDIGYHYGIEYISDIKSGYHLELFKGRDDSLIGSHCEGHNSDSLGICVVGEFDSLTPSEEQYKFLAKLCKDLIDKYKLSIRDIYFHRDFNKGKSCPGTKFDKKKLIGIINNGIG